MISSNKDKRRILINPVFLKWAIIALSIICSLNIVCAQPVSVRAFTDKNKILLGEPFWLTLEVKVLNNKTVNPFKIDSIPHFEFIIKDSINVIKKGDTSFFNQKFQLTSFDSGRWIIPQFTFRPFVKTNSILMDVVFTENFDSKQAYHDVQKIKDVPFILNSDFEKWWYLIAATLIILTLIIYQATKKVDSKRKSKNIDSDVTYQSPETIYKKALQNLKELKGIKTDEKEYYAQLVEIFRTYVLERTGISSLQQTSNNLVEKLQPLFDDKVKYDSLSQVLYLCDFVKFAKYNPDQSESESAFEVIENAVHYIESELKRSNKKEV